MTMTKTEAINVLKKELQIMDDPNVTMTVREWREHEGNMREALYVVVEELEQGPSGDCISRRAAIEAICKDGTMLERRGQYSITMAERKQKDTDILEALPSVTEPNKSIGECMNLITNSPTIDAVKVVRCRECEYWECNPNTKNYGVCGKVSYDDFDVVMERDDFCSYGRSIRANGE